MALFYPKTQAMGIDLSDRSIKIGQIKKRGSNFIFDSLGEKSIPSGFINGGIINNDKENEIIGLVKQCLKEVKGSKIKTKKAICSLPEEDSFIKIIQIPKTSEEEIGEVVKWQIESNFPVRLKDISFDWQLIPQTEGVKEEKTMSVCVSVVPNTVVNSYFSIFSKAGIEPIVFEIESMASVRGLINDYIQKPIILIDFGQCGTGLTFFSGDAILFTSHIDISGQKLTESIAKSLKIGFNEAEDLKQSIGLVGMEEEKKKNYNVAQVKNIKINSGKKEDELKNINVGVSEIFSSLIPILTDLIEQIKHYIDYFKDFKKIDNVPSGGIEKIIICGGEAKLFGFDKFLSEALNIPVELGDPLKNISISKKISKNISSRDFLSYVTLIGLAKRNVD